MSSEPRHDRAGPGRRIRLLDVVALTADQPQLGLFRGHVGTVVEVLGGTTFEVEFCEEEGRTYALAALTADQLLALHHRPVRAL